MADDGRKNDSILDIYDLKQGFLEELHFVLASIGNITEDERNFVEEYMIRYMEQLALGNERRGPSLQKQDIMEYKEKIKSIKDEIKYLKKLKKKKEELQEKEGKRYQALRELFKDGQLDSQREEEYKELRKKYKGRKRI